MRRPVATSSHFAGLVICITWLFHTTFVDRLDITKLAVGLVFATLGLVFVELRSKETGEEHEPRMSFVGLAVLGLCLAIGSIFYSELVAARVEGWAPWVVAFFLFVIVRADSVRRAGGSVALVAAVLTFIGFAQALGSPWFISGLSEFEGRPVMGTLGNPGLFGVCLAGAIPFIMVRARRVPFAILTSLVVAAIILSGARTAWVMLVPGLIVGVRSLPTMRVVSISAGAILLAGAVGLGSPSVNLESRISDLSQSGGTASGRLYLWKVHLELVKDASPVGGGPETFRRRWPWAQAAFLEEHPEDIHFHSDLRHAHADAVEILVDWGWGGLLLGFLLLLRWLIPRSSKDSEDGGDHTAEPLLLEQRAARGSLLALLLGGLAFPVLFQPPSLFLAAAAAGVLAPVPKARPHRLARAAAIVGIMLSFLWVGQRLVSEVVRTTGLRAEVAGRLDEARTNYCLAADLDPRNPLALIMCSRSVIALDPARARDLADAASTHLPTAPVYAIRAAAELASGNEEKAAESWSIAVSLRPSLDAVPGDN